MLMILCMAAAFGTTAAVVTGVAPGRVTDGDTGEPVAGASGAMTGELLIETHTDSLRY